MGAQRRVPRRIVLLAAAASLGVAGCGGAGDGSVRSFGAIEIGDTEVEILAGGTAARISVSTDPPTVCAAAFGETESLGRIANDPSMGGTAIREHAVVLRELRPGSTYHYRLTATDAAGTVYQTGLRQFVTTPPKSEQRAAAGNVALGSTVVEVSSEWGGAFAATSAVDGDLTTEWSSAGDGDGAFLTIDLGRRTAITGVAFRTREMADGSAVTRRFTVTVDGDERLGPYVAGNRASANAARVSTTGRVLRFDVATSTGGNTGAVEIEVYSGE